MKFGMVNKSTTVNRFVLHILQRNITRLAVKTRKTNIKFGILKGGGELEKSQFTLPPNFNKNQKINKKKYSRKNVCRLSGWKDTHR